jgi:hypothetical protein
VMQLLSNLKMAGRLRQLTHLEPVKMNITRWSSKHDMIERYFRLEEHIKILSQGSDASSIALGEQLPRRGLVEQLKGIQKTLTDFNIPLFSHFFTRMTKIDDRLQLQINTLSDAGIKPMAISRQLGLKYDTLFKGKINGRWPLQIKKYLTQEPTATLERIIAAVGLPVSVATLHRYLKRMDWPRKAAKRQILLSEANRQKRLEFCQDMLLKGPEYYNRIIWTDETMVKSHPNGEVTFYRAFVTDDPYIQPRIQNSFGVMFWGAMSRYAYGPLRVCQGTINGAEYLQLLKDVLIPEIQAAPFQAIYQQDNAPAHKKREVMAFLNAQEFETLKWPPQSPDLSPIEWVWNVLKMKIKAMNPRPRGKSAIVEVVLKLWDEFEDEMRIKIVDTFQRRLEQCVARKGGFTDF